MFKARFAAFTVAIAVAGAGLTACGGDRWCEEDATDTKVADRFCEANTPGYEWESGDGGSKSKKKKKSSSGSKRK